MKTPSFYLLGIVCAAAILLRLIVIPFLGNGLHGNPVDVYYVDREAARLIIDFQNPYLYSNYTNHLGEIVTFAYLPMVPICYAPFVLTGLDIRYGSIIADVLIVISIYSLGRSLLGGTKTQMRVVLSGPVAYAILPISIWLTSVAGTNMMIGSMFLFLAFATLVKDKDLAAGMLLGIALVTNQFVILVYPLIVAYLLRSRKFKALLVSIGTSCAIIVPFVLYSSSNFIYDTFLFQFERAAQQNGIWSLYNLVYSTTGYQIPVFLRIFAFLILASITIVLFSNSKVRMLVGIGVLSALGAFILPIDGFLNYFLLPATVLCAILPVIVADRYKIQRLSMPQSQTNPIVSETLTEEHELQRQ
jgi:hypothetical protein